MIDENKYLQVVSETNADITPYFDIAISQEDFRDILVKHLLEIDSINVYYHSYLILNEVTKAEPSLFYHYWDQFSSLLSYDNSYHRNYGMELIANLVVVDKENRFELIVDDYYKQLNDEKISTKKYCISHSAKIINEKPKLANRIISKIIESLRVNDNTEKHQNFLISELIKLLSSVDYDLLDKIAVNDFLKDVLNTTKSDKVKREIKKYSAQYFAQ